MLFASKYTLVQVLHGPHDSVASVALSPDGVYVAAIGQHFENTYEPQLTQLLGSGRVWVWDLMSGAQLATPLISSGQIVTVCQWIHMSQANRHILVLGTSDGTLMTWNKDSNAEVPLFNRIISICLMPLQLFLSGESACLQDRCRQDQESALPCVVLSMAVHHKVDSFRARVAVGFGSYESPFVAAYSLSLTSGLNRIFRVALNSKVIPKGLHIDKINKDVLVFAMHNGDM